MGGNALKTLNVERITRAEYGARMADFLDIWKDMAFGENDCPLWYMAFPAVLRNKEDFGDLDVLYTCLPEHKTRVLDELKKRFNSRGSKNTGPCTSIEWNNLQVDMIYCPSYETMKWATEWYSHGDFIAIIGRVFRYYHFIFKNNGLYFKVGTDNLKEEIFCSLDWRESMKLLRYAPTSSLMSYDEEDLYPYVFSSPLAFPALFNLVKRERTKAAVKDKRPMQARFYERLDDNDLNEVYPRSHGWKLLYELDHKLYWKARRIQVKLVLKELVIPVKRVYKKTWNKTLKPRVYKLLGKDIRSKRNVRN